METKRYARTANFVLLMIVALFFILLAKDLTYALIWVLGVGFGAFFHSSARLAIDSEQTDGDDDAR